MILVILGIGLVMLTVGIVFCSMNKYSSGNKFKNWLYRNDWAHEVLISIGCVVSIIALMAMLTLGITCSQEKAIDIQIQMYQDENTIIENTVSEIVKDYQIYEKETFESFKPEEIMVAINLYPELNSNELVAKQIAVHTENNNKIKELLTKKINLVTYKWWLYFG